MASWLSSILAGKHVQLCVAICAPKRIRIPLWIQPVFGVRTMTRLRRVGHEQRARDRSNGMGARAICLSHVPIADGLVGGCVCDLFRQSFTTDGLLFLNNQTITCAAGIPDRIESEQTNMFECEPTLRCGPEMCLIGIQNQ